MKIGIAGSGMIVRTLLETLPEVEAVECVALCVREQSAERGRALAEEFGVPTLYTDYDQMLENPSLDFIYIGIVNQLHFAYARAALLAGRNVILEKPFTTTADEARELAELAVRRGVFLFEAITNQYFQSFAIMKERLPELGEIKLVQGNYSQYSSRYDRYLAGTVTPSFDPACYGGALYDINIYNLHLVIGLFGAPQSVRYLPNLGPNGVDTSGIATLRYDGFAATCCGAKDSESPGFFVVQGTKGYMRILGYTNACERLEIAVGGRVETFSDPTPRPRMAAEFEAFERIWGERDHGACAGMLAHTVRVMEAAQAARLDGGLAFV